MDNGTTFSDSNFISGSSSICCDANTESLSPEFSPSDIAAMGRLSENFESIFNSSSREFDFFADARIAVAGGREVAVHRNILSARSPVLKTMFSGKEIGVKLELKELAKDFDVSFDALVVVLAYLYSGKVGSLPKGVCACVDDECSHDACRPAVNFKLEVLYASFTFRISELVAMYQRHLLNILHQVTADEILVVLSLANICGKSCERLLMRCIENIVRSNVDIMTLDRTLPKHIVKQIVDSRKELGLNGPESSGFPDKHMERIHKALDSNDVESVRKLLKEDRTTLDNAFALHYAVSYCNAETTKKLLDLAIADVNHRNLRGYTVLHVAAMRKEPNIILFLLTKGARPFDLTSDGTGRKALEISKRLTRAEDYYKSTEKGKASPKDRLCIEILEKAEGIYQLLGEAHMFLWLPISDPSLELLDLETRVGLAKLLFPSEAEVAMYIAQVDGTFEFPLAKNMAGVHNTTVDSNDSPSKIKEKFLKRITALSTTVVLGKHFFPRCSKVLNEILYDDDLSELAYRENEPQEEWQLKKQRYMETLESLRQAFNKDKWELDRSNNISSSSSSTCMGPMGVGRPNVGLAKFLYLMEAKVATDIAQVDGTSVVPLANINSMNMAGVQRTTEDLNDAPFIKREHLKILTALSKTVELWKHFFPRCSEVLNKMMADDGLLELAYLENETQEELQPKKKWYMELQEVLSNAFNEDKQEFDRSNNISSSSSSSSSSTSVGIGRPNGFITPSLEMIEELPNRDKISVKHPTIEEHLDLTDMNYDLTSQAVYAPESENAAAFSGKIDLGSVERSEASSSFDAHENQNVAVLENQDQRKTLKGKCGISNATIGLEVLEQCFSMSLIDAAKTLNVSRSKLKRNCRKHGIPEWPYRKRNKLLNDLNGSAKGAEGAFCTVPLAKSLSLHPDAAKPHQNHSSQHPEPTKLLEAENISPTSKTSSDRQAEVGDQMLELSVSSYQELHDQTKFLADSVQRSSRCKTESTSSKKRKNSTSKSCQGNSVNSPCLDLDSEQAVGTHAHEISHVTTRPEARMVTMKAKYGEDMIRFQLSSSSGIVELKAEVTNRLKLEADCFKIKYLDEHDDWILIVCEKDLHNCMDISGSLGNGIAMLQVQEIISNSKSSRKSKRQLKRK